jgi:ribonuclease P protein component
VTLSEGMGGLRGDGGDFRFLKEERLRSDREYREVVRKGERGATPHFTIYRDFLGGDVRKVGISVGKRVGRAVVRNRMKRVLREFYRIHKYEAFPRGSRTAIVAKKAPSRPELAAVSAELLPAILRRWGRKGEPSLCGQEISSSAP